jgi:nicotinamidase-related amidase
VATPWRIVSWTNLIPELDRQPGDIVVTKRTWGAFASIDLESQLKARGVTQVVVTGVATGTGAESTARQAYEAGFNVTLATDAMTDSRPDAHDHSIANVFRGSAKPARRNRSSTSLKGPTHEPA